MLRIARFVTRCQTPKNRTEIRWLADAVAREQLPRELGAFLGPSLSRDPSVVRIRRLRVRILVRGRSLDRQRLMEAWVRAIGRQLFTALAYPHGGHFEIERAPSRAHFRARLMRDLLSGAVPGKWIYAGQEALFGLPRAEAVMMLLRESPAEMTEVLEALFTEGSLEPALAILNDVSLEEIFRTIATAGNFPLDSPRIEWLAEAVRVLRQIAPSRGWPLDSRAQALRMFVAAVRMGVRLAPRAWLTILAALALFAEYGELWTASPRPVEQICGGRHAEDVKAFAGSIREKVQTAAAETPPLRGLLMEALRAAALPVPEPAIARENPEPWREFDAASLLLVTGPVLKLGWAAGWRGVAAQATLYALACAVRGNFDPLLGSIDPSAAIFAGIFGEVSPRALRDFYANTAPPAGTAADWPGAMDQLAARLIQWWTERLPGFRKSARSAIVRQFLTTPGRVRVEENRVVAWLAHNPLFVALRIANLDDAVENVPWLGGRQLVFRLEGL